MAERSQVDFDCEIAHDLPAVFGDPAKLTQIFVNLLTNAIKFTKPGGSVLLRVARTTDQRITFRVEDTGIRMSADQIPIALEPFGQVDAGFAPKHGGVGLGLPLTKRLVELHEGTIEFDSELSRGTTVIVSMPEHRVIRKRE